MFACSADMSEIDPSVAPGQHTVGNSLCPVTCNECPFAGTASPMAAGDTHAPVPPSVTSAPAPVACVDDPRGELPQHGLDCSTLVGMFACSADISEIDPSTAPGLLTVGNGLCPVTCNECPVAGTASPMAAGDTHAPSVCVDDPTGALP